MKSRVILAGGLIFCCLTAGSCSRDAKSAWNDVIKRCAASSLNGPTILYFGPSNAVGPGSIWRRDASGTYRLRYDLSQMPEPKNFLAPYSESTCDGTSSSKFTFGGEGSLDVQPITADMKADFKAAKSIEAKATAIAWVPVAEGPYEAYVNAMDPAAGPRTDLLVGDKFVLTRALIVKGFSATLDFSRETAAALKAKYNGPLAGTAGSAGGGINASWSGETKLTITSNSDFYIAGEFQRYKPTGLSATGSPFEAKADVPSGAVPVRDPLP
jgi:hypothetical protein